jgi:hypothetical protein
MPIARFFADAAFDAEETRLLVAAFEAAWQVIQRSGSSLADETHAASTRARLAKRVIEMGRRGERNHDRLVEAALLYLANAKAASDVAIATDSELPGSPSQGHSPDFASTGRAPPCR